MMPDGVSYPVPVLAVMLIDTDDQDEMEKAVYETESRYEDAYWNRVAWRRPFSWSVFAAWWVARRWIVPRDVRKR